MSVKTFLTGSVRRRAVTGAAVIGAVGAVSLGLVPMANAGTDPAERTPVTVTVSHQGRYVTAICAGDILEARCQDGIRTGDTSTFTVKPKLGEPITVSIVPRGGRSTQISVEATGATGFAFVTGGSANEPTVTLAPAQ